MKLTDEEMKLYYAARDIDAADLLSTDDISLSELPPGVQLGEPNRTIAARIIAGWNRLDPMSKIDAALSSEERVIRPRRRSSILDIHIEAEAWCADLMLGRIRGTEARREVMQKIARGELDLATVRRGSRARKASLQRPETAAILRPVHIRLEAQDPTHD